MSLFENQTFKKQLKFVNNSDPNKILSFAINLSCNHDVDKSILNEIESTINKLVLIDYITEQKFKEHIQLQKENLKLQEKNEKLQNKLLEHQNKKSAVESYKEYKIPVVNKINTSPTLKQAKEPVKKGIRTLE